MYLEEQGKAHLQCMGGQELLLAPDHEGARGEVLAGGGHLGDLCDSLHKSIGRRVLCEFWRLGDGVGRQAHVRFGGGVCV